MSGSSAQPLAVRQLTKHRSSEFSCSRIPIGGLGKIGSFPTPIRRKKYGSNDIARSRAASALPDSAARRSATRAAAISPSRNIRSPAWRSASMWSREAGGAVSLAACAGLISAGSSTVPADARDGAGALAAGFGPATATGGVWGSVDVRGGGTPPQTWFAGLALHRSMWEPSLRCSEPCSKAAAGSRSQDVLCAIPGAGALFGQGHCGSSRVLRSPPSLR